MDHVALMGLENTGFAIANDALLWIDPIDYRNGLAEGVERLVAAGVMCPSTTYRGVCSNARCGLTRFNLSRIGRTAMRSNAVFALRDLAAADYSLLAVRGRAAELLQSNKGRSVRLSSQLISAFSPA